MSVEPRLFAEVFEDDRRGAAILEHLTARFAQPVVTKGGIDAVLETYRRAGQRAVLDYILNQINRAHGVHDAEARTDGSSD